MHTELQTLLVDPPCVNNMPLLKQQQQQLPLDLPVIHNLPIQQVIEEKIESVSILKWESDQENAFFVADIGEVYRQHLRWKSLLPRIEPFFGKHEFEF